MVIDLIPIDFFCNLSREEDKHHIRYVPWTWGSRADYRAGASLYQQKLKEQFQVVFIDWNKCTYKMIRK